jgi:hypothetical protein
MADQPFWMSFASLLVSAGSLVVSAISLLFSRASNQQSQKMAALAARQAGINYVREALNDIILHGNITAETVASLREAAQISKLWFTTPGLLETLNGMHGTAFRLSGVSWEQYTEQDRQEIDALKTNLGAVLKIMQKEASLQPTGWFG